MGILISSLMQESGVGFGTSGARGLADAMTDLVCYAYTSAFLQHLESSGDLSAGCSVAIAGDYRPSTPRIMAAAAKAVEDKGLLPLNCGFVPSPTVALFGIEQGIPAIMVTGSHIPDDRNGIKFNKPSGEILKQDEAAIRAQSVAVADGLFDDRGRFVSPAVLPAESDEAYRLYRERYLNLFPADALEGKRIGLYEHSGVARQILGEVLEALGAEVVRLGFSKTFIPVDTEAIRPEDVKLAKQWAFEYQLDSVVSTDGDGDRPLVSDENGNWLRGDVAGILCARYLGAQRVVTPVSSNSAVEKSGWFDGVTRTRIGSPYVIEAMEQLLAGGRTGVVGYEANGGFLIADRLEQDGRRLEPLPTRDAVIVILSILMLSKAWGVPVSGLLERLPARYTCSDRLKNFPREQSLALIGKFSTGERDKDKSAIEAVFGAELGPVKGVDETDGLRITFESSEVVHLRPSGNAPELRCYNEAETESRAQELNRHCMDLLEGWRKK